MNQSLKIIPHYLKRLLKQATAITSPKLTNLIQFFPMPE